MADNYVIAFDMLETLLDLSALDDAFREHFGGSRVRYEWFAEVQNLMLAFAAADRYESVSDIGEAALKVVEERHRQKLSWWNRKEILQRFRQVPAFPDAAPALQRLHSAKIRLVVLTNTARKAAQHAIESAGLNTFFEDVISAEDAGRLKPAADPYLLAAKKCKVKPRNLLLVAAHTWDITGAKSAGCAACFVQRPGKVLAEVAPKPDLVVPDLQELASQILRARRVA
jgi:2-haloacid dehalogenase